MERCAGIEQWGQGVASKPRPTLIREAPVVPPRCIASQPLWQGQTGAGKHVPIWGRPLNLCMIGSQIPLASGFARVLP